ncbi:MAG: hypothetical protein AABX47_07035 [Nanoarchaeota archaeon]
MKTTKMISISILITALFAMQAFAAAPIWDPSVPSRYVSPRDIYIGQQVVVPAASSSGQSLDVSTKLGGEWPSRPTDPIYGGRLTGYATLDSLPKNNYISKSNLLVRSAKKGTAIASTNYVYDPNLPANKQLKRGYVTETQISGKLSRFPVTRFTPKFSGRWIGPATTPTYKSDLKK